MRFRRNKGTNRLSGARRRTARRLESAAALVDESPTRKRRRKPLVLVALAGIAGWIVVKARSNAPHADELVDETAEKVKDAAERSAEATERTAEQAKKAMPAQQPVKSGNAASQ